MKYIDFVLNGLLTLLTLITIILIKLFIPILYSGVDLYMTSLFIWVLWNQINIWEER